MTPKHTIHDPVEAGRTCHRCGDLAGWSDVTCPGCNELLVKGKTSRGGAASTGATPSMTTRDGAVTPLTRAHVRDTHGPSNLVVAPVDGTPTLGEAA